MWTHHTVKTPHSREYVLYAHTPPLAGLAHNSTANPGAQRLEFAVFDHLHKCVSFRTRTCSGIRDRTTELVANCRIQHQLVANCRIQHPTANSTNSTQVRARACGGGLRLERRDRELRALHAVAAVVVEKIVGRRLRDGQACSRGRYSRTVVWHTCAMSPKDCFPPPSAAHGCRRAQCPRRAR